MCARAHVCSGACMRARMYARAWVRSYVRVYLCARVRHACWFLSDCAYLCVSECACVCTCSRGGCRRTRTAATAERKARSSMLRSSDGNSAASMEKRCRTAHGPCKGGSRYLSTPIHAHSSLACRRKRASSSSLGSNHRRRPKRMLPVDLRSDHRGMKGSRKDSQCVVA